MSESTANGFTNVGAGRVRHRSASGSTGGTTAVSAARSAKYGRWRAVTLASVYLLMGIHIAHWTLNGTTLAPLELNEVMYTLEAGIVTAGFLLMATLFVGSAIFGRFFCSWACHIMALEDLCAWIMRKIKIRPRVVRSRLLPLVPIYALFDMFVWPQILRVKAGRPLPEIRILTDADGWASFVTTDFWRNLPGPWIIFFTFAISGFLMVYLMASRSFCYVGCPYGVIFSFVDRIAPGRIKLTGDCEQCATCTAVCTSHIRVHEEVAQYGKVVDANCLKDLDCVASCPNDALSFGFSKPAPVASWHKSGRRALKFDFSWGEEILMAAMFFATVVVFRGLYVAVPFLMTIGLGVATAYLTVMCVRLVRRTDLRLSPFRLKASGKLTRAGVGFAAIMFLYGLFFAHSGFIRYHEVRGLGAIEVVREGLDANGTIPPAALQTAISHLQVVENWGLYMHPIRDHQLADLHLKSGTPVAAEPYLRRIVERDRDFGELDSRLALMQLLIRDGRADEAALQATELIETDAPIDPPAFLALGRLFESGGRIDVAAASYARAADGYRTSLSLDPDNVSARNDLGFLLIKQGDVDAAAEQFRKAIELRPDFAQAYFNLGRIHEQRGEIALAEENYRVAASLDGSYAAQLGRP